MYGTLRLNINTFQV